MLQLGRAIVPVAALLIGRCVADCSVGLPISMCARLPASRLAIVRAVFAVTPNALCVLSCRLPSRLRATHFWSKRPSGRRAPACGLSSSPSRSLIGGKDNRRCLARSSLNPCLSLGGYGLWTDSQLLPGFDLLG